MIVLRLNNGNCCLLRLGVDFGFIYIGNGEIQIFYMQGNNMFSFEIQKNDLDEIEKVSLEQEI